ncbi:MAG: hypothetical protein AAB527_01105 [Patescibacteria group bacterium]|mgnify:FL=1
MERIRGVFGAMFSGSGREKYPNCIPLPKDRKTSIVVIKNGRLEHEHSWLGVNWNEKLGPDVETGPNNELVYKFLMRCTNPYCKAEAIRSVKSAQ